MNHIGKIKGKNILLLQGPNGPFFRKFDDYLTSKGAHTLRIGFNYGDQFFSNKLNYTAYKDKPKRWKKFIKNFLSEYKIDLIFLFGDNRFYQRIAKQVALENEIEVFVFEEGYIRPYFITMEKFGVNGHSKISRDRKFYDALEVKNNFEPKELSNRYGTMAWYSTFYYSVSNIFYFKYPNYKHHRDFSMINEAFYGIRNLLRKNIYKFLERDLQEEVIEKYKEKYYFVPLQVHNDFQLRKHSQYKTIEEFILEVLLSFSKNAPEDTYLVFKHHPMDRGKKNYTNFLRHISQQLDLGDRVISIFDLHLPTCLMNARATITINSTVGLSSIYHQTPTIVLGNANYDIEGLTCKSLSLDNFWTKYYKPDHELYLKFRDYLVANTQVNGSFYGDFPHFDPKIDD